MQIENNYSIEYIDTQMTGREFEVFTKELLENNGFHSVVVTPSSNDFGVDVLAVDHHGIRFSIQCKKYQGKVDNKAVQEVFSSKAVHNCHVAAVLTNSYFTNNAIQLANANNVLLWDRSVLLEMMKNINHKEDSDGDKHHLSKLIKNAVQQNNNPEISHDDVIATDITNNTLVNDADIEKHKSIEVPPSDLLLNHNTEKQGLDNNNSQAIIVDERQTDSETVEIDLEDDCKEEKFDLKSETRKMRAEARRSAEQQEKVVYIYPPTKLLSPPTDCESDSAYMEMQTNAGRIMDTLTNFGVRASIINICRGPVLTRYEIKPAPGVKRSRVIELADEIAFNLGVSDVHIVPSIPGKAAIGIDVLNKVVSMVTLRELIETDDFRNNKSKLNCVLGRDISGEIICTDLAKMPHLLIAGTTGSGKSVCVNALLMSILFKATPDEVKLLLVDPKMVEFSKYKGIPHLLVPVVSDAKKAAGALNWAVSEMLSRYRIFAEYDCKGIDSYNELIDKNLAYIEGQKLLPDYDPEAEEQPCLDVEGLLVPTEHMCRIVIVIDELADLMRESPAEVEESICRLAQMAHSAGMHLVIATSHFDKSIITAKMQESIPSRIAFKVNSKSESRIILNKYGAERLIGYGDMLYSPVGVTMPIRVKGCFTRDEEIERVTAFIKKSHTAEYNKEIEGNIRKIANDGQDTGKTPEFDSMMEEAIKVVTLSGQASTSLLQRYLKVGYARAGRMIDDMEQMGIVGPHQESKPRDVLMTYIEWLEHNHLRDSTDERTESWHENDSFLNQDEQELLSIIKKANIASGSGCSAVDVTEDNHEQYLSRNTNNHSSKSANINSRLDTSLKPTEEKNPKPKKGLFSFGIFKNRRKK